MALDLDAIGIEVRSYSYLRRFDPDEWIQSFQISAYTLSEEGYKELEVAQAQIHLLDGYLGLDGEGINLLEACDAHSQELLAVYETLFDEKGELRPPLNDAIYPLVWYFDYVIVRAGFRGNGLGKEMVEWILGTVCRYQGVAVVLPCPLELDHFESDNARLLVLEDEELKRRVRRFWEETHFFPLEGTEYMYRNLELKPGVPSLKYKPPRRDNVVDFLARRARLKRKT